MSGKLVVAEHGVRIKEQAGRKIDKVEAEVEVEVEVAELGGYAKTWRNIEIHGSIRDTFSSPRYCSNEVL